MSNIDGLKYSQCGEGWIAYHEDRPRTGVYVYQVWAITKRKWYMAKSDGTKLLDSPVPSRALAAYHGHLRKENLNNGR